jgi:DNA ligase (NAD+)
MFKSLGHRFAKLIASHVELHPVETCPECGSQLARDAAGWGERPREPLGESKGGSSGASPHQPVDWRCPNPDCPPQVLKRVALWASPEAMDIRGCDAALVAQLVNRGLVRDAAEFYRLKIAELASLDGFDLAKARALWDAIQASKQREAWRVLFGLGIPNIGAAEAQTLCQHFARLEDMFAMGRERLAKLDGVTEVMARSLTHWQGDPVNRKLVRRLAKAGVNFDTRSGQTGAAPRT